MTACTEKLCPLQGLFFIYPGSASPCVFSLGRMTAMMFDYTQWFQGEKKTRFAVKQPKQDSKQHIRICPGHTQHSLYLGFHVVHMFRLHFPHMWFHIYTAMLWVKIIQTVKGVGFTGQEDMAFLPYCAAHNVKTTTWAYFSIFHMIRLLPLHIRGGFM